MKLPIFLILSLFVFSSVQAIEENSHQPTIASENVIALQLQIQKYEESSTICANNAAFFKLVTTTRTGEQYVIIQQEINNCINLFHEKQKLQAVLAKYKTSR